MRRLTPGTVTIGVFAILFGLAAAYAARRYFDVAPEVAKPAPRPKTVAVVFAKINLPPYARIRDEDVTVRQVPVDEVPAGVLTSKSRALFRLVKTTILADQPVADADLFAVGEVPKLSDRLTPGHRALTLPISGEGALNGMIQPESHVDINLTVKDNHPEMGGMATMTVMRNVRVLATSDARFPRSEDRPYPVNNVTVSVTPEDANKLILAQRYGTLSMTLCSSSDTEQAEPNLTADSRHLVNKAALLGLAPLPIPAEPTVVEKTAEVWRGGKRVEVTFNESEILEALNATEVSEGREPMQALPVSVIEKATRPGAKKAECKECAKKKAAKAAAAAAKTPTLAPPRTDSAAVPVASGHVASQVLEVQVEAQQAGAGG